MILNNLIQKKIILASNSPRRKKLLEELGLNFEVRVKENISENIPENLKTEQVASYLAEQKAKQYEQELKADEILITADTIVSCNGYILNKPLDYDDAVRMLDILSNTKHQVITGVCIKSFSRSVSFSCTTDVYFKHLHEDDIEYYIEKYRPYDKAGAYGIQEWIGYVGVEKIDGCFYNVVGLPIQNVYEELKKF